MEGSRESGSWDLRKKLVGRTEWEKGVFSSAIAQLGSPKSTLDMFVLQKLLIDCVWGMWNTEGSLSQMHHQIARETTLSVHNCNSDTRQNFGMGTWHLGRDVCYQCREVFFSPHQDQKKVTLVTRTRLMRTGHRQRMSSQELEMEGMPKYQTRPTFRLSSCCFHVLEKLCSQGLRRVLGEPGVLPRTTRN